MVDVAKVLGIQVGKGAENALFQHPSATGTFEGLPLWIGTVLRRRKAGTHTKDFFFLQVVVGRNPSAVVTSAPVGREALEADAQIVPFSDVQRACYNTQASAHAQNARTSVLDGGRDVEIYPDKVARVFAVAGIKSRRWKRRVIGTAHTLNVYAKTLH